MRRLWCAWILWQMAQTFFDVPPNPLYPQAARAFESKQTCEATAERFQDYLGAPFQCWPVGYDPRPGR